mmetsp:Transcript_10795/g.32534  ORF Transcript_10795/g.32534 Transcript_10795/m.32534 type:complete len:677 (-) Transcript_10795:32-2062(-)
MEARERAAKLAARRAGQVAVTTWDNTERAAPCRQPRVSGVAGGRAAALSRPSARDESFLKLRTRVSWLSCTREVAGAPEMYRHTVRRLARAQRGVATTPWFRAAGESCVLARFGNRVDTETNERVLARLRALDAAPLQGVVDLVPAYASLAVHYDAAATSREAVEAWVLDAVDVADGGAEARVVELPTVYDGEDLAAAASAAGLESKEAVAAAHAAGDYRVFFLGFTGGFPYLGGLDARLASVPRLETPRQLVPKGSVGIAAGQTGVYTRDTPGGWHLLGRTAAPLFDPARDPPALLRPGDLVRFVETDAAAAPPPPPPPLLPAPRDPVLEVAAGGVQSSLQDLGRVGHARHGVSRSGAADEHALRVANAVVGNAPGTPALEVAAGGLRVKCVAPCAVGLAGADCGGVVQRADGSTVPAPVVATTLLFPGDELRLGPAKDGARAYVSLAGGFDAPVALGSASSDLRAGLGGQTLQTGDVLGRAASVDAPPRVRAARDAHPRSEPPGPATWSVRVLPGPGDPGSDDGGPGVSEKAADALARLVAAGPLVVSPRSDRMAVVAASSTALEGGQQLSEACASGTIQLPPDGNPVILLAEHQTTGGYVVPGVVARADLWKVGQARPGDLFELEATTADAAAAALRELRAATLDVERLVTEDVDLATMALGPNQMGEWEGRE